LKTPIKYRCALPADNGARRAGAYAPAARFSAQNYGGDVVRWGRTVSRFLPTQNNYAQPVSTLGWYLYEASLEVVGFVLWFCSKCQKNRLPDPTLVLLKIFGPFIVISGLSTTRSEFRHVCCVHCTSLQTAQGYSSIAGYVHIATRVVVLQCSGRHGLTAARGG
jgi:hypothetical protein